MTTVSGSPVELERLIDGFSRDAFHRQAAWFVGAGASRPSKLAGWVDLLKPLGRELGITVTDKDDLPAIAQYYINYMSGNRAALIRHLTQILGRSAQPSIYHHQLARSNVATIWTTNYDPLIEDALAQAGLGARVRVREADMVEPVEPDRVEVIKVHGSFGVSAPDEFVIATADYEDFADSRPATIERLRSDLLRKTFLFVGYGYGDPNIKAVLLEARRLAQRVGRTHYMLSVLENPSDPEKALRQRLWQDDLRRIGIQCVLMPGFAEIEAAVARVARRSRGPTVYVTGSHSGSSPLAAEVGTLLADPRMTQTILLDGQSSGVSRELLFAFQDACVRGRIDLNTRLRFFANPYASNPAFSSDPALLPVLKEWRGPMLRQAHSVLVFDGGMGTEAEVEIARELGCCIVPVPQDASGSALTLLNDPQIVRELDARAPDFVAKARGLALTAADVVDCLLTDMPPWPF